MVISFGVSGTRGFRVGEKGDILIRVIFGEAEWPQDGRSAATLKIAQLRLPLFPLAVS
jgi:hypothetical protein